MALQRGNAVSFHNNIYMCLASIFMPTGFALVGKIIVIIIIIVIVHPFLCRREVATSVQYKNSSTQTTKN